MIDQADCYQSTQETVDHINVEEGYVPDQVERG